MHRLLTVAVATAISLAAFSSCSNDPTLNNGGNTTGSNIVFQQIDRVGKPGIKELFLPYGNHDAYDRDVPANDLKDTAPQIATFMTTTAGRTSGISQYVQQLLLPDALIFDLKSPATRGSYLGYETNGALAVDCTGATPTAFGGRGLNDDVVDATLALAFGSTATTISAPNVTPSGATSGGLAPAPDDGKEQNGRNGTPQLTTDNVTCVNQGQLTLGTFPYLANPI